MLIYLGTHKPHWLEAEVFEGVPLLVSRQHLLYERLRRKIRSRTFWGLDSGAVTEISMNGQWAVTASQCDREGQEIATQLGRMDVTAIQDWLCG